MVSYADLRNQDICPLPFSEIEANMVSLYCGESCFVGAEASKNHLLNCGTKRNIHIATHGFLILRRRRIPFIHRACCLPVRETG